MGSGSAVILRRTAMGLAGVAALLAVATAVQADTFWGAALPALENWLVTVNGQQVPPDGTAVAVTNVGNTAITADIRVNGVIITTLNVPAQGTTTYQLPNYPPYTSSTRNMNYAYRVDTSGPAVAAQFTPLLVGTTNDASRLLSQAQLGTEYWTFAYFQPPNPGYAPLPYPSFITIVGTAAATSVQITPSAAIAGGAGVPFMPAGATTTVALAPFETLTLRSSQDTVSLTGSRIVSNNPIAVFSGTVCSSLGYSACDHTSEQMSPAQLAGPEFILCTSAYNRPQGFDRVEVIATSGPVTLTMTPPPAAYPSGTVTLPATGVAVDFEITENTFLAGTSPFMVGMYYGKSGGADVVVTDAFSFLPGDPSLVTPIPLGALDANHQVYTQETWVNTRVNIGGPIGATVDIDGIPVTQWFSIPGTPYGCAVENVVPGTHFVNSDMDIDVTVLGIGGQGTYWYETGWNNAGPPTPPPPLLPPPPPPPLPTASFEWDPLTPCIFDVQFSDTSITPQSIIMSWTWDFGDGQSSTQQNPTHTYSGPGPWTVTLTIVDGNGNDDTYTLDILLCVGPDASFTAVLIDPCGTDSPSLEFIDTSVDPDGAIAFWVWTFDDGTVATGPNPLHSWGNDPGTHAVQLQVTDIDGASDVVIQNVAFPGYIACPLAQGESQEPGGAGAGLSDGVDPVVAAADWDGDGVPADLDNCPYFANSDQTNTDGDRFGDACDADMDDDGVRNGADVCLTVPDPGQDDADGDRIGNACDDDDDGDGIPNATDPCPGTADNDLCGPQALAAEGAVVGSTVTRSPTDQGAPTGPTRSGARAAWGAAVLLVVIPLVVLLARRRVP